MMNEFSLLATNTQFRKKKGKLWTFQDRALESQRQLDYILVRRKWRNSVQNAEAYNTFSTVGSDHRVVTANMRLSLRTSKNARKVMYDWKQFTSSPELQQRYTVTVKNRYQVLESDDNNTRFNKFKEANEKTMEECVPKREKKKTALRSADPQIVEARGEAEKAKQKWQAEQNEASKDAWKQAVKDLYKIYDQVMEQELAERIKSHHTVNNSTVKHGKW